MFGFLPPNPWKLFCPCPWQSQTFPRNAHREEIPTLDSTTASGGTGLLRMRLSPLCTGKITCKYNMVLICFVPGFLHPNSTDMKGSPQATVVFPLLLLSCWSSLQHKHARHLYLFTFLIQTHCLHKCQGKKCNIVSPVSKITTYCLCTLLLLLFYSLCWLLLCWWCPTAPRAFKAEWWFFSCAVELIIHS